MAPLNSLENEYPLIDSNFQTFCASHAIYSGSFPLILFPTFSNSIFQILFIQCHHYSFFSSVEDFLLHDLDALLTSAAKHSTSQRLKQVRVTYRTDYLIILLLKSLIRVILLWMCNCLGYSSASVYCWCSTSAIDKWFAASWRFWTE